MSGAFAHAVALPTAGDVTDSSATRSRLPFNSRELPTITAGSRGDDGTGKLVAGRYRVQRLLGTGGMGAVWLAEDEVLRRPVAIKNSRYRKQSLTAGPRKHAFSTKPGLRPLAAARVSHPGVVRVHDLAVEDHQHWSVMEALTGPTLEAAIRRRGRIAVGRMVEVAVQLLEALQAVHREGIVHGDVKPSNIQLCRMSRAVRAIAVTTAVGTAPWRPPSSSTSLPCARPTTGAVLTMDSAIPTMRLAMSMARAVPTGGLPAGPRSGDPSLQIAHHDPPRAPR